MIDFHCHLDLYPDPQAVRQECERREMYVLSVTTTPSAWNGTSALAANSPRIRTALGLHPQLAHERKGELALFDSLLPQARYVGEIGLDGAPEFRQHWQDQVAVFEHILAKCGDAGGKILSIHSRHASEAVLDRLEKNRKSGIVVLHWFSGSRRDLDRAINLGCWFSVGPAMLTSENGRSLASRMPKERVLTESDGPFAQLDGGSVNPWQVRIAIEGLAQIWSVTPNDAQDAVRENLRRILETQDGGVSVP